MFLQEGKPRDGGNRECNNAIETKGVVCVCFLIEKINTSHTQFRMRKQLPAHVNARPGTKMNIVQCLGFTVALNCV